MGEEAAKQIRTAIALINQRMKQQLTERLQPYQITPQQARLIGFVGTKQEQGQTIYQRDIEEEFELRGPSVTSLLQGLERKGFIARRVDPSDERLKQVIILPKGLDLLHDFEAVFAQIDEQLMQGFSPDQQQQLAQALEHMAQNVV
ncbi:MarR family transcriptional regulator [Chloroflexia bacterium SDU3-3]|nr:MarR family transcriptional regulator [Chloroflexia bacterium SDU3-3]